MAQIQTKDLTFKQLADLADQKIIGVEYQGEFLFVQAVVTDTTIEESYLDVLFQDGTAYQLHFNDIKEDNSTLYFLHEAIFVDTEDFKGSVPSEVEELGGYWKEVEE